MSGPIPMGPSGPVPPYWPSLPPSRPPRGNRRLIWLLLGLVCVLTAVVVVLAVSLVGPDRHEIAQSPTTTSAPTTSAHRPSLPPTALDSLLPDRETVSSVARASDIGLVAHGEGIDAEDLADADCQGILSISTRDYAGSGWTAIRWQLWNSPAELNPTKPWRHVSLSVVAYPQADSAQTFFIRQRATWRTCNVRMANSRIASATDSPDVLWFIVQASESDGVLTAIAMSAQGNGWTCQVRMTARNNVVVRVGVCGYSDSTAPAETLLDSITRKIDAAS